MTSDIALTNAQRRNLLTLQGVDELSARTQQRLSSGKKINTVLDGAVTFFRAKTLNDTASDFNTLKDGIDQGLSALNSYLAGVQAIEQLLTQIKGLVEGTRSQTQIERRAATLQFKELGKQIHNLIEDTKYNGIDLLARTSSTLLVKFGTRTTSFLKVGGLNLNVTSFRTGNNPSDIAIRADQIDKAIFTNTVFDSTGNFYISKFLKPGIAVDKYNGAVTFDGDFTGAVGANGLQNASILGKGFTNIGQNNTNYGAIDAILQTVTLAIDRIRSQAAYLGNAVGVLTVRLAFTKQYVNELNQGSDKLTLADLNEEGANLVALQTRQQLGLQSLKISTDNQKAILNLLG